MMNGKGMYLNRERNVLLTCVKNHQVYQLKQIVSFVDPKAFVIISDAVEVRGKGFQAIIDEETNIKDF